MDKLPSLEPAKIRCTSTDCGKDKHCYRPTRGHWQNDAPAECQNCGDKNVDMSVTRSRDVSNPAAIFRELGREFIRDHFLYKPIDVQARGLIRRDGLAVIRSRVAARLEKSIGKIPDIFDGRQTKLGGDIIFYAQHATATCCRKCAWYWYGIPRNGPMSAKDLGFCNTMVQAYLDRREGELLAIQANRDDGGDV